MKRTIYEMGVHIMIKCKEKDPVSAETLSAFVEENDIRTVRVAFTDLLGLQRGRLIPAQRLIALFSEDSQGLECSAAVMALGFDDEFAEVDFMDEKRDDMSIMPDLSTLQVLPYVKHTAIVQGDLYYDGAPYAISPRMLLKQVVAQYHALGYEPICACELEFYAYQMGAQGERLPYVNLPSNCYTVGQQNDPCGLIEKINRTVSTMDFDYLGCNHEFCSGQYEFNWKHSSAVKAADRAVTFKALCKDLAFQTGTQVTFMGMPKGEPGGSGCHIHISLVERATGENLCFDPKKRGGLSDLAEHLAAGILRHAQAISPCLAPTVNCYKRYQPETYAPTHIAWGDDNRTTYIRVPKSRGKGTRLEVRVGSASCNPYIAIAAILLAGLDGIQTKLPPPPMVNTNIYRDLEQQLSLPCVPTSLSSAVNCINEDPWAKATFPPEFFEIFVALKEREAENFNRAVTDWEMDTYFSQM